MRLLKLSVKNWGPHKELHCDLDSPLTGIIGANGSGKSCLLTAISYAVTGVLPLAKERYIREYDPENPERSTKAYKAEVTLKFEVNGQEGEIKRSIWDAGTSRSLRYAGCTHTKQADVDKLMEELMGADKAALQNAVFIKQGELTELIQGTPATRQEIFRRLMNLNFLSIRADDVKSKLRLLETRGAADNTDLIDTLLQMEKEQHIELEKIEAEMAPLTKAMQKKDLAKEIEDKTTEVRDLTNRGNTLAQNIHLAKEALSKLQAEYGEPAEMEAAMKKAAEIEQAGNDVEKADTELKAVVSTYMAGPEKRLQQHNKALDAMQHVLPEKQLKAAKEVYQRLVQIYFIRNTNTGRSMRLAELKEGIPAKKEEVIQSKVILETALKAIEEGNEKIREYELQQQILQGNIDTSVCPVCGQTLTMDSLLKALHVSSVEEGLAKLQEAVIDVKRRINTAEVESKSSLPARVKEAEAALEAAERELYSLEASSKMDGEEIVKLTDGMAQYLPDAKIDNPYDFTESEIAVRMHDIDTGLKIYETFLPQLIPAGEIEEVRKSAQEMQAKISQLTKFIEENEDKVKAAVDAREKVLLYSRKLGEHKQLLTRKEELEKEFAEVAKTTDEKTILLEEKTAQLFTALQGLDYPNDASALAAFKHVSEQYVATHTKFRMLSDQLVDTKAKLEAALEARAKVQRITKTASDLSTIAAMLSREGLPAAFMQEVFSQLTGLVQHFLSQMDANFTVRVNETQPCSFLFSNMQGYEMPQESLSGGQAVRLALSMLLAAQRLILPEVGLLILDEPTSHVDAEGVESMKILFQNLATVLQNAGMQLIVVDHNPALQAGFVKSIIL